MYGFFKNKRIVLFDTLVEQCQEEEVTAVLAHELGGPCNLTLCIHNSSPRSVPGDGTWVCGFALPFCNAQSATHPRD